ncbi:hypothetical protein M8J77_011544 [Diaphorina citri]|nr:hypothetical protein M8J77_011544 [Diaphorina citri]
MRSKHFSIFGHVILFTTIPINSINRHCCDLTVTSPESIMLCTRCGPDDEQEESTVQNNDGLTTAANEEQHHTGYEACVE